MRLMRDDQWWNTPGHLADIALLRERLNARDIDGTDWQIAAAYGDYCDWFYAASWLGVTPLETRDRDHFADYVEEQWLSSAEHIEVGSQEPPLERGVVDTE